MTNPMLHPPSKQLNVPHKQATRNPLLSQHQKASLLTMPFFKSCSSPSKNQSVNSSAIVTSPSRSSLERLLPKSATNGALLTHEEAIQLLSKNNMGNSFSGPFLA